MKYDNGKIYKLIDNTNGNIYIGSTIQPLYKRKSQHKEDRNKCRSKFIIDNGDYDIILIEKYPCESKEELEARERYYIESIDCINKNIPGRSSVEWYQDNKERILEKSKNKIKTDDRKDYEKDYSLKNKDIKREYDEQYRKDKKEEKQKYFREHSIYKKTWGGDPRNDNNLLKIDINLFI